MTTVKDFYTRTMRGMLDLYLAKNNIKIDTKYENAKNNIVKNLVYLISNGECVFDIFEKDKIIKDMIRQYLTVESIKHDNDLKSINMETVKMLIKELAVQFVILNFNIDADEMMSYMYEISNDTLEIKGELNYDNIFSTIKYETTIYRNEILKKYF